MKKIDFEKAYRDSLEKKLETERRLAPLNREYEREVRKENREFENVKKEAIKFLKKHNIGSIEVVTYFGKFTLSVEQEGISYLSYEKRLFEYNGFKNTIEELREILGKESELYPKRGIDYYGPGLEYLTREFESRIQKLVDKLAGTEAEKIVRRQIT